jgi:hypothetical protein
MGRVSVLAGPMVPTPGGSSVNSTILGQISTPSSFLNNSRVEDFIQCMTSTLSATPRRVIVTPTAMPGTSSHNRPAPSGTSQTDSMRHVVCSPASGIASFPTLLSSLENLPIAIHNPQARAIITYPLRRQGTERYQRQRQCQLQPQAVTTPR